ncbi:MAG: 50S ribosomal protein L3, partial [Thermoplasmatales archaeon]|nr:50S ribosomal protein L3 [Thermoplasmatales archaeon]
MSERHHPKRGSHGFSPRKRAKAETPHIKSWAEDGKKPKIQGFFGYKAGMTH